METRATEVLALPLRRRDQHRRSSDRNLDLAAGAAQTQIMDDIESAKVEQAVGKLAEAFPEVPTDEIATLVHTEHAAFDGRPVRDYVPVLVERAVRARLRGRDLAFAS
jgi:hypothetical protein